MLYEDIKFNVHQAEEMVKLAYFAGIIDGEGCIGIEHLSPRKGRLKDYYLCRLTVINTNEDLMKLLKHFFKGNYDQRKLMPRCKPTFRWHVFGKDQEDAINKLLPFLFMKKEQAKLVLKYRETVNSNGWLISDEVLEERKNLWLACKKLNSRINN